MPDGRALKPEDIEKLNRVARDYEWVLFGCSQLAGMLNIHLRLITAVASHPQSPFGAAGKKARPEWVFAFLRDPPKGFASPK